MNAWTWRVVVRPAVLKINDLSVARQINPTLYSSETFLLLGGELLTERCRTDNLMPDLPVPSLPPCRVDPKVLGLWRNINHLLTCLMVLITVMGGNNNVSDIVVWGSICSQWSF